MCEPTPTLETIAIDGATVSLLGSVHVSARSVSDIQAAIDTGQFDVVAVELCPARAERLCNGAALADQDLLRSLRGGRAMNLLLSLALGSFQNRVARKTGIRIGADMLAAMQGAADRNLPCYLMDRNIGTTFQRLQARLPLRRRLSVLIGMFISSLSGERSPTRNETFDLAQLQRSDAIEALVGEVAQAFPEVHGVLLAERDRFMAARLLELARRYPGQRILAVLGAAHVPGVAALLRAGEPRAPARALAELCFTPQPSRRWRWLPYGLTALILAGFGLGFATSPVVGWSMVRDWIMINGGLAALGAAVALGHPLTILGSFLAAPITSLNPMIGAGMVAGAIEVFCRRPTVGDFERLGTDTLALRGWWQNRVSRALLVCFLATMGSGLGTYIAAFLMAGALL